MAPAADAAAPARRLPGDRRLLTAPTAAHAGQRGRSDAAATKPPTRTASDEIERPCSAKPLARYAALVDDAPAFFERAAAPLPRVVWPNALRPHASRELAAIVRRRSPSAVPVGWWPGAWRIPPESEAGRWPEYATGLYHCQEEASLLAVWALAPEPGERVLDLCAAPGGKTALCAVRMQDRGLVVANEPVLGRIVAIGDTLARLGITSAVVVRHDGRTLAAARPFDRALVDAPCSCEGNSRKQGGRVAPCDAAQRARLAALQRALLDRALELVRPGGLVVYSTCTYAPEENESVVADLLAARADVRLEPIPDPTPLRTDPGITAWAGRRYPASMAWARRLWPHHADTGGFFVARLRRL